MVGMKKENSNKKVVIGEISMKLFRRLSKSIDRLKL